MRIYIYEGIVIGRNREDFVRGAALNYLKEKGDENYERANDFEIARTEKGKPYFVDETAPHFSVSDSGQLWVCIMSDNEVGIDIQEVKDKDYTGLAKRFFTPEEAEFVKVWGRDGFFLVWTRKESYLKQRGTGILEEGLGNFSVLKNGGVAYSIGEGDERYFFYDVDFGTEIICTVCSKVPGSVEVRLL